MKTQVTDFNGDYKAYRVETESGSAYQPAHYGRAVDIGRDSSTVLSTKEAQAIYGDAHALKLVNPGEWPGKIELQEAGIRLVTLSMSFNEIVRMGAALSKKHGGQKLSKIPTKGEDKISQAFAEAAREHSLVSMNQYFVTSRALLESFVPNGRDLPELESGMGDSCMEVPNETVGHFKNAAAILHDLQGMLLFNELDFPGYASTNRYYVSGLFLGGFKTAKLPVKEQTGEIFPKVMAELHRTLG